MSWHYLQGREVASWAGSCLDGAPSALSNLIPIAEVSCLLASMARAVSEGEMKPSLLNTYYRTLGLESRWLVLRQHRVRLWHLRKTGEFLPQKPGLFASVDNLWITLWISCGQPVSNYRNGRAFIYRRAGLLSLRSSITLLFLI